MFQGKNFLVLAALLVLAVSDCEAAVHNLEGLRGKIEEAAQNFDPDQLLGAGGGRRHHPLYNGAHQAVAQAQKIKEGLHESMRKIHEELVAGRQELAGRLAHYEEGDLNFSIQCALLTTDAKACTADDTCTFCASDKLAFLNITGLCASLSDGETLTEWGLSCGDNDHHGVFEEEAVEDYELSATEEEEAQAAALTGMRMVSEVAYVQESSSAEEEEEESPPEVDKFCLEHESVEDCEGGNDEEGNSCVWCKYNSWLGTCVTTNDQHVATDSFALTCGAQMV